MFEVLTGLHGNSILSREIYMGESILPMVRIASSEPRGASSESRSPVRQFPEQAPEELDAVNRRALACLLEIDGIAGEFERP